MSDTRTPADQLDRLLTLAHQLGIGGDRPPPEISFGALAEYATLHAAILGLIQRGERANALREERDRCRRLWRSEERYARRLLEEIRRREAERDEARAVACDTSPAAPGHADRLMQHPWLSPE